MELVLAEKDLTFFCLLDFLCSNCFTADQNVSISRNSPFAEPDNPTSGPIVANIDGDS